jgi:glycosyltransferase involved in cell wall biosynthesis
MGGMVFSSEPIHSWDVVFAETEWHRASLATVRGHNRVRRAFGVNTDIYKPIFGAQKLFDWITVGAWALWKRQHLFADRPGFKLAVGGNYAARNTGEAAAIIDAYLRNNVIVAAYVPPPELARLYNASHACYIPAETLGGGERAVLEARACGIPVRVENDNPKLAELANGLVHSHHDYAAALRAGIEETLHG